MAFPFPIGDEQYSRNMGMRLFHFCSLGMVQLLLRVALGDLLWKQLSLFTAKVVTHARPVLCRCQKPSRFDYRVRGPGQDDGSMRLSQGLLVGRKPRMMRTPDLSVRASRCTV